MKISVRTCPATPANTLRPFVVRRLQTATRRLAPRLRDVSVDVTRESPREGGRFVARVQGTLASGGSILIKRDEKDPRAAVAAGVERFRRSLVRTIERVDRAGVSGSSTGR